jgi:hypothetical protein
MNATTAQLIISGASGLLGAVIGACAALYGTYLQEKRSDKRLHREEQLKLVGKVRWFSVKMSQLEASRAEAEIQSNYHEYMMGKSTDLIHSTEAKDKQLLSIKYAEELSGLKAELYDNLMRVEVYFGNKFNDSIDQMFNNKHIAVTKIKGEPNQTNALKQTEDGIKVIVNMAEKTWLKPLKKLANDMRDSVIQKL